MAGAVEEQVEQALVDDDSGAGAGEDVHAGDELANADDGSPSAAVVDRVPDAVVADAVVEDIEAVAELNGGCRGVVCDTDTFTDVAGGLEWKRL